MLTNRGADVFDGEVGFSGDAIFGKELVDGGTQELAIDEELEGDRLLVFKEIVDKSGQGIAA